MSLIWMVIIGVIAGGLAKLLLPQHGIGGLFTLGIGGSMIAGTIQYSLNHPIGFVGPSVGAVILLALNAVVAPTPSHRKASRDDFRRAA